MSTGLADPRVSANSPLVWIDLRTGARHLAANRSRHSTVTGRHVNAPHALELAQHELAHDLGK
jgi:hypothetical protein